MIKEINPKIAVGSDFGEKIFLFKKLFPQKISIAFQYSFVFRERKKTISICLKIKRQTIFLFLTKI